MSDDNYLNNKVSVSYSYDVGDESGVKLYESCESNIEQVTLKVKPKETPKPKMKVRKYSYKDKVAINGVLKYEILVINEDVVDVDKLEIYDLLDSNVRYIRKSTVIANDKTNCSLKEYNNLQTPCDVEYVVIDDDLIKIVINRKIKRNSVIRILYEVKLSENRCINSPIINAVSIRYFYNDLNNNLVSDGVRDPSEYITDENRNFIDIVCDYIKSSKLRIYNSAYINKECNTIKFKISIINIGNEDAFNIKIKDKIPYNVFIENRYGIVSCKAISVSGSSLDKRRDIIISADNVLTIHLNKIPKGCGNKPTIVDIYITGRFK